MEHVDDWKLEMILDYCNKSSNKCIYLSLTFDDFIKDEYKISSIDWRREVWAFIGWTNWGNGRPDPNNGGQNRLKEVYDKIKSDLRYKE